MNILTLEYMKNAKAPKLSFWITNISNKNVTLSDLAINIKAFSTINLLDKRHYQYTHEQLILSQNSGSIYNKRDKISVRDVPPDKAKKNTISITNPIIPNKQRSLYQINNIEYDELKVSEEKEMQKISDEIFARDNADLIDGG